MVKSFEMERGYYEVNYLLRAARVDKQMRGYQLLQTAIMSHLRNPKLTNKELIKIAKENSPMHLENDQQCFEEMKIALHNVCTTHMDKLEDDNVVFKFIDNISTEVRIGEIIRIHMIQNDIDVGQYNVEMLIRVCIRKKMKPNDSFSAILNHTAGKCEYDELKDFVNELFKVVSKEKNINLKEKRKKIKMFVEDCLIKKDDMTF